MQSQIKSGDVCLSFFFFCLIIFYAGPYPRALLGFARQVFPFSQAKRWQYDSLEGESLSLSEVACGFYLGTSSINSHIVTVVFLFKI